MGCVEGSGVPVLYIGRRVPKGYSGTSGKHKKGPSFQLHSKHGDFIVITYTMDVL
jgi:hypothetical protein